MAGKIVFSCLDCKDITWVTWVSKPEPCFCCGEQGMQKWQADEIKLAEKLQQSTL